MKMQRSAPGIAVAAIAAAAVTALGATAVQKARQSAGDPLLDGALRVAAREGAANVSTAPAVPGIRQGEGSREDDAKIAAVTTQIMERSHYARQAFNDDVSARLFDEYMTALDPQRLFLFKSDVADWADNRTQLDDQLKAGDISFAQKVFARYLDRYKQQVNFSLAALKDPKNLDFSKDELFVLDRKKAERPADAKEAEPLWLQQLRYQYLQEKLTGKKQDEIVKALTRRYERNLRALQEYDSDDIFELYLTTLTHAYDPHSDYFGRASAENFSIGMKLSLYGIGARLKSEDGYTVIEDITPGSPAEKSKKLKPGDKIVAVAQGKDGEPVDVVDMKLTKVVEMIRGPKSTMVRLTIQPAAAADPSVREVITIVRDEIKLEEQAASSRLIVVPGPKGAAPTRLGVIDLPLFYSDPEKGKSATADVAALLRKLKSEGVDGVILDLRKNGGGSLPEAIDLAGLFIKKGPVVQVRDPDGDVTVNEDKNAGVEYDGPLVVLTSRFSASASEIVAGALQDYGRGIIVGDKSTFGKGTVQALVNLGPIMQRAQVQTSTDPGQLKLTIQKFYRASGASTQLEGVKADVELPSLNSALDIGESKLEHPLPYDTIKSADYQKLERVTPFLVELKSRSAARVSSNQDFAFLREQIARLTKIEQQKTVSLNEKARLAEKKELEARLDARDKQLAVRPAPTDKVYAITLREAAKPGLPAPLTAAQLKKGAGTTDDDDDAGAGAASADSGDKAKRHLPEPDANLDEAKRILSDYIALSRKSGNTWSAPLAANRK